MNIKEACRYANFLEGLGSKLNYILSNQSNQFVTVITKLKSKTNPDAIDEVEEVENDRIFSTKLENMVFLLESIINEKNQLSIAISRAKSENLIDWKEEEKKLDFDSAIQYNKQLRSMINTVKPLTNLKDKITQYDSRDYKLNAEGNQVSYIYKQETKSTVDFNKEIVLNKTKKILEKTDKISTLIEEFQLKDIVKFEPKYSLHDSLEEIIHAYESTLK